MKGSTDDYVRVRLYAAARSAVGMSEINVPSNTTQNILNEVAKGNSTTLSLFSRCSILIQGEQLHDLSVVVLGGSEMDILPPFAGGSLSTNR